MKNKKFNVIKLNEERYDYPFSIRCKPFGRFSGIFYTYEKCMSKLILTQGSSLLCSENLRGNLSKHNLH